MVLHCGEQLSNALRVVFDYNLFVVVLTAIVSCTSVSCPSLEQTILVIGRVGQCAFDWLNKSVEARFSARHLPQRFNRSVMIATVNHHHLVAETQ